MDNTALEKLKQTAAVWDFLLLSLIVMLLWLVASLWKRVDRLEKAAGQKKPTDAQPTPHDQERER